MKSKSSTSWKCDSIYSGIHIYIYIHTQQGQCILFIMNQPSVINYCINRFPCFWCWRLLFYDGLILIIILKLVPQCPTYWWLKPHKTNVVYSWTPLNTIGQQFDGEILEVYALWKTGSCIAWWQIVAKKPLAKINMAIYLYVCACI